MRISKIYVLILILICLLSNQNTIRTSTAELIHPTSQSSLYEININNDDGGIKNFTINLTIPAKSTFAEFTVDTYTKGELSFTKRFIGNDGKCLYWLDVNGDDYPEIIQGTHEQNYLFINNCNGTLTKIKEFGTSYTQNIDPADYDNDGDIDFVIANMSGPSCIYENRGNFNFISHMFEDDGTHAYSSSWADVDLDGDLDLAFGNGICGYVESTNNTLYINDNGEFTRLYRFGNYSTISIRWLYFNNDSYPNICVVNQGSFQFFINNKDYSFTEFIIDEEFQYNSSEVGPYGVRIMDYDEDNDTDILVRCGQELHYFENINYTYVYNGTIIDKKIYTIIDINQDGELDKVYCDDKLIIEIKKNNTYKELILDDKISSGIDLSFYDFDKDNDLDILLGQWHSADILVNNIYIQETLNLRNELNSHLSSNPSNLKLLINLSFPNRDLLEITNITYSFQLDNDLDSISDELDFDDDNDGYLDEWELLLETDPMDSTSQPIDTDGDDSPNGDEHNSQVWMDYDDDNDGFNDTLELEIGTNPLDNNSIPLDYDNDGIIDYFDNDDDNDGYNDTIDQFPLDPTEWFDTDGDGIGDNSDYDIDGDGFDNTNDSFPIDNEEWQDFDNDGIGDNADNDSDNDNYNDTIELKENTDPFDPEQTPQDLDGDFIPNTIDIDIDGDGVNNEDDFYPYDKSRCELEDEDNNIPDPDEPSNEELNPIFIALLFIIIAFLILFFIFTKISKKRKY